MWIQSYCCSGNFYGWGKLISGYPTCVIAYFTCTHLFFRLAYGSFLRHFPRSVRMCTSRQDRFCGIFINHTAFFAMITLGSTLCTVIKIRIIFFIIDLLCTPGMFLTWHGNRTAFVDCAANDAVIAFSSCNRAVVRIFSVLFSFLAPDMFIYFI